MAIERHLQSRTAYLILDLGVQNGKQVTASKSFKVKDVATDENIYLVSMAMNELMENDLMRVELAERSGLANE